MFSREITLKDVKATEKNRFVTLSTLNIFHQEPLLSLNGRTIVPWDSSNNFMLVQELEDINHAEYMKSICNDETLRKLSSGKVGHMFLLSKDDRFLIKILRKSKSRTTLLSKNYGAHSLKPIGGVKAPPPQVSANQENVAELRNGI
ncbi:hypothetical protein Bca52824_006151 [Brassica carinata]|uniref:1-phosphatidylinositol-4-phosphate 5-kinase n=1 Tax=Brassica carinata TaxID=52824 RepID=A0A8X7WSN7_BRACI|nr:hypothetical protein Bca52824_006151 [Brassica carinata]